MCIIGQSTVTHTNVTNTNVTTNQSSTKTSNSQLKQNRIEHMLHEINMSLIQIYRKVRLLYLDNNKLLVANRAITIYVDPYILYVHTS